MVPASPGAPSLPPATSGGGGAFTFNVSVKCLFVLDVFIYLLFVFVEVFQC
jgi:hypothetical protein